MLVLTRREGESVQVGDHVVKVIKIRGASIRLGFAGPRTTNVCRTEILDRCGKGGEVKR